MKKLFAGLMLMMATATVLAEASFSQIESLIEQRQYGAAAQGLEEIIKNHPQSAKAFYAMAQAQAGLGHLDKARYALDKAQGLEPSLSFASSSNVETLRQAITPQSAKIEPVSEGHFWATLFALLFVGLIGWAIYKFREQLSRGVLDHAHYEALRTLKRHLQEGRVQIKLFTRRPLHGKTYICHREDVTNPITAFVGSSNLTMSGLQHNYELNVDVVDWDGTKVLAKWFEDRWNDRYTIEITADLIELIQESWAGDNQPSPYDVYLKVC
mgnify:CR=1 FL=1